MEKLTLANLPTKIEKLERLSAEFGANIWLKRDDHTGSEISGNKVRKLEFCAKDALEECSNSRLRDWNSIKTRMKGGSTNDIHLKTF